MSALRISVTECSLLPTVTEEGGVLALPTLTASTYGSSNNGTRDGETRYKTRGKPSLDSLAGGPLSPRWCEWYMGFPDGWTDVVTLVEKH